MSRHSLRWSVIVHGGARPIPLAERARFADGCLQAVTAAAAILSQGGSALDAVEMGVRFLEDMSQFNAGRGSVANAAGDIEMDAAIMDGETLALGGVGAIRDVRHPIAVARALLFKPPILLTGSAAGDFAAEIHAEPASPVKESAQGDEGHGCDTVGCVARDIHGHLAAAGSTGGIAGKMPGRIGDTPLPGCGLYADDQRGAVACSGDGESIARVMVAAEAIHALAGASPAQAARSAIDHLGRVGGEAGAILIDPAGRMGIAHSSDQFSIGIAASWLAGPRAATDAADLKEWLE